MAIERRHRLDADPDTDEDDENMEYPEERSLGESPPDVFLDVPRLSVDEITLEVDGLHAQLAVEVRLADLLHLHIGADAEISHVALEIKGVDVQAQLQARLENVVDLIDRALATVDRHPEILGELARGVGEAADSVVDGVGEAVDGVGRVGQSAVGELGHAAGGANGDR